MATKANLFNESKKKSDVATLGKDRGLINPISQTSIVSRATGSTTINSGIYAQIKCDKASGVVTEIALQSVVNAVQRELTTSDLIINRHKLNTQLFEFTNLKENMGTIMGGLTVNTTVLVKVWEPTLEQYVLIRRPARHPVFGNLLDAYELDERLYIDEQFGGDIIELKKNLNDLKENVEEKIKEVKEHMVENTNKIADDMKDFKENVKDWESFKEYLGNDFEEFKENIKEKLPEVSEKVEKEWNEFKENVSDGWNDFKDAAKDKWNEWFGDDE